jgi:NAD(P)-dependent dehydrogenase (short-subunit alcohol dehydrogenase family)
LLARPASVILLASTTIHQGTPGMDQYAASEAAVRSLGRTWAAELAPRGVRVNVITPGTTAAPRSSAWSSKLGQSTEDLDAALASQLPLAGTGGAIPAVLRLLERHPSQTATGAARS